MRQRGIRVSSSVSRLEQLVPLALIVMIAVLPACIHPVSSDFQMYYDAGTDPLEVYTASVPGFYYLPWSLGVLWPLSFLPAKVAWGLFNSVSLILAYVSMTVVCRRGFPRMVALLRPVVAVAIWLGQWDGLLLGGALIGEYAIQSHKPALLGLALLMLSTKPQTVLPVILLCVVRALRWPARDWGRALLPMAAAVGLSLVALGWWPARYLQFVQVDSPVVVHHLMSTVGDMPIDLSVPWGLRIPMIIVLAVATWLLHKADPAGGVAFALVLGLALYPFTSVYSYVTTAPAIAWLYRSDRHLGMMAVVCEVVLVGLVALGLPGWVVPLLWTGLALLALVRSRRHPPGPSSSLDIVAQ